MSTLLFPSNFKRNVMKLFLDTSDLTVNPQEDVVKKVTGTYSMYMINFINNGVIHVFTLNCQGKSNENGPTHL